MKEVKITSTEGDTVNFEQLSPITVNATDPSEMAPAKLHPAGPSLILPLDGTTSTDSASTSTIVSTTSTSNSSSTVQGVPEFPSVSPLVAAATLFALIVLGGLVLRVRKGPEPSG